MNKAKSKQTNEYTRVTFCCEKM